MSLFDSLAMASRSLSAAQLGLEVAGQNIANANTEGYSRRVLSLQEVAPTDSHSAGHGVSVVGIEAARDQFVTMRLWNEMGAGAFDRAVLEGLAEIEGAVGLPGASLDADLAAFFDSFSALADDPTSATARQNIVVQGEQLARSFAAMADHFDTAARGADTAIVMLAGEVNQLASEVAQLNEAILANGVDVESLRDRREVAVSRLSELVGVTVVRTSNGNVDLTVGAGRPLVIGVTAYTLDPAPGGVAGYAAVETNGFDITAEITTGRIGGLIALRDAIVPGYSARLDQLAYDLATEVNVVHQSGYDAGGAAAGAFFVPLSGVNGAAGLLAVAPALSANAALVAASSTGAVGDNQTARAIAGLRDAQIAVGDTVTPSSAWGQLAYRVGSDLASRRSRVELRDDIRLQLERLRDQTSAVSMDEEAANLIRFQRAYEANARYFMTISDTLDSLMNMVG